MLINFEVENFKSYKETVVFSMERGAYLRKHSKTHVLTVTKNVDLLKSAFIFGPNANGKTTLLDALKLLNILVVMPTESNESSLEVNTFANNSEPTSFNITFFKNDNVYNYFIRYNQDEVLEECLKENEIIVLKRKKDNFIVLPDSLDNLKDTFRNNQLLLYLAQSYNYKPAQVAFSWFTNNLVFINTGRINSRDIKSITENPELKDRLLNFLQAADFGINDIEVISSKFTPPFEIALNRETRQMEIITDSDVKEKTKYELLFTHESQGKIFKLTLGEESEGTRVFLAIAIQLMKKKNTGSVILIDEFDKSLHHELILSLMDIFNDFNQNNQFVVTTHDLDLMDYNLRSDQIWFAEKDKNGKSSLFSIFDFSIDEEENEEGKKQKKRSDFGFKKRYLKGIYGANQIVNHDRLIYNLFDIDEYKSQGEE